MKRFMSSAVIVGVALILVVLRSGIAQDVTAELLARLSVGPFDESILYSLEGQPADPRIIPALWTAFDKGKQSKEKQWIAATLLRIGDKSAILFDYLAGAAKDAIDDRTPFSLKYDNAGKSIPGEFNIGFLNWCAQNGKNPGEIARNQWSVYVTDVRTLAYAEDLRADELLRNGLDSPNPLVIAYSVEGLGRLHDIAAIPLIEKSLNRVNSDDRHAIAIQLCWFGLPVAERLFERFVPDQRMREFSRRPVLMLQTSEQNRRARRLGKPVQ